MMHSHNLSILLTLIYYFCSHLHLKIIPNRSSVRPNRWVVKYVFTSSQEL